MKEWVLEIWKMYLLFIDCILLQHVKLASGENFTALIQISTREKDYVVDPFSLWDKLGLLNEIFADEKIIKVRQVLWLLVSTSCYKARLWITIFIVEYDTSCLHIHIFKAVWWYSWTTCLMVFWVFKSRCLLTPPKKQKMLKMVSKKRRGEHICIGMQSAKINYSASKLQGEQIHFFWQVCVSYQPYRQGTILSSFTNFLVLMILQDSRQTCSKFHFWFRGIIRFIRFEIFSPFLNEAAYVSLFWMRWMCDLCECILVCFSTLVAAKGSASFKKRKEK